MNYHIMYVQLTYLTESGILKETFFNLFFQAPMMLIEFILLQHRLQ